MIDMGHLWVSYLTRPFPDHWEKNPRDMRIRRRWRFPGVLQTIDRMLVGIHIVTLIDYFYS